MYRRRKRFIPGPGVGEPFNPWDNPPELPFPMPHVPDMDPGFSETDPSLIEAIMKLLGQGQGQRFKPVAPKFVNPPRPFVEAPVVGGQNANIYKGALAKIKAGMSPQGMLGRGADMLNGFQPMPTHPQGPRPEPRMPMAAPPMASPGQNAMPRGGFAIGEPEEDFDPRSSPDFWGNWPYPKAKRPPTNAF